LAFSVGWQLVEVGARGAGRVALPALEHRVDAAGHNAGEGLVELAQVLERAARPRHSLTVARDLLGDPLCRVDAEQGVVPPRVVQPRSGDGSTRPARVAPAVRVDCQRKVSKPPDTGRDGPAPVSMNEHVSDTYRH
jgi:hypothetical protein